MPIRLASGMPWRLRIDYTAVASHRVNVAADGCLADPLCHTKDTNQGAKEDPLPAETLSDCIY
ncbi:MAG: hypothetical protein SynsKO_07720 [Synoicihabitans sp.]